MSIEKPRAIEIYSKNFIGLDEKLQNLYEENFFKEIQLKNETYKTTYHERLKDLDKVLLNFLPKERPLKILDVAVSSGLTTLEWSNSLSKNGIEHEIIATDLNLKATIVSCFKKVHILVGSNLFPLQWDIWGKCIPNYSKTSQGRNLKRFILLLIFQLLFKIFIIINPRFKYLIRDNASYSSKYIALIPILLVSPRVAMCKKIKLLEQDLLYQDISNFNRKFHVIRAANILNKAYFDDNVLLKIIRNLKSLLTKDGVFVVCRTNEQQENNASIFRLGETNKFLLLHRVGNGCEIENLILNS
ncbi:MAG: hypothetical protein JW725_05430 [Candidatus Babeliaceae bacterium]|nr:hypothetical protein [Candidatus Babeliaceae bacterium]